MTVGPRKEFAEEIDFAAQLVVRNWLDEFFRGRARDGVEFGDLRGGRARDFEALRLRRRVAPPARRLAREWR